MRLAVVLYLLGLKLRWSAWRSAQFRAKLRRVERVIVIRTQDGRQARTYSFRDGTVRVHGGVDASATVEMVWRDARVATSVMLSGSQLENFSAIGRGDLAILGNLQDALWFSDLAGQ
jgi:hypothetical protein